MNKKWIKAVSLALALGLTTGLVACGGTGGTSSGNGGDQTNTNIDPNKQQIYVYAVNNGMGYKWAEKMAADFNALPENSSYQVVVQTGANDLLTNMNNALQAESTDVSIYFGCQSSIVPMIRDGRFVDITDVYETTLAGESKSIKDKTLDYQLYKNAFSGMDGNGIYAVPYSTGMSGMLFDYEYFLEYDYLDYAKVSEKDAVEAQGGSVKVANGKLVATAAFGNYKEGDKILTAGKDGKYGTYDDGQATTIEDFYKLLSKIIGNQHAPYIFNTQSVEAYVPTVYQAIMAQNMGYENYYNFMALSGDIKNKNGEVEATLTAANGASAWKTDTIKNAYDESLEFFYRTIIGNLGTVGDKTYKPNQVLHKSCVQSTSMSHLEAQDKFISGYQDSVGYSAFLIEGTWWENEAKGTFDNLIPMDEEKRGFGEREYRYYLYPSTSTQVTSSDKSVMAVQDDGCGVLFNNTRVLKKLKSGITKDDFISKCKEFLAFTLSDANLEYYTTTTGNPRPFDYTISEENLAKMTPFQRNCWEITHDTEHVSIVNPNIMSNLSVVRTIGQLSNYQASASVKTPYAALNRNRAQQISLDTYVSTLYDYIDKNYSKSYNLVKNYIK